jgi:peptide/nickel transport system substrate-binding protein
MTADWTKGPQGTGEAAYNIYGYYGIPLMAGDLAKSWDLDVANQTITYHLHEGVMFHDKAPVNGRELVADDVVATIEWLFRDSLTSSQHGTYPWDTHFESVTALDNYTVEIVCQQGFLGPVFEATGDFACIWPRESIETTDVNDWRNAVGSGPFVLVDYVEGNLLRYEKHPDYFGVHPLTGDQMPYLDGVKFFIMTDPSTRLAALRTGKLDWMGGARTPISWEEADNLAENTPDLNLKEINAAKNETIHMGINNPPLDDIRVRKAIAYGINQQEIADTFFGGKAVLINYPVAAIPEYTAVHTPIADLPEEIAMAFGYHPAEARALLTEAGYPDGIETDIVCDASDVDLLSIVKSQLANVGITLTLTVKERGAWQSSGYENSFTGMYSYVTEGSTFWNFARQRPVTGQFNFSEIDDPKVDEYYTEVTALYFEPEARAELMKEAAVYHLAKFAEVQLPNPSYYSAWWPWVKLYSGETFTGLGDRYNFVKYVWYDTDLKQEMGY